MVEADDEDDVSDQSFGQEFDGDVDSDDCDDSNGDDASAASNNDEDADDNVPDDVHGSANESDTNSPDPDSEAFDDVVEESTEDGENPLASSEDYEKEAEHKRKTELYLRKKEKLIKDGHSVFSQPKSGGPKYSCGDLVKVVSL